MQINRIATSRIVAYCAKYVNILEKKGVIAGEIDVLVLFANRAIVLQAKSKKLTLESRKGNDLAIKKDFKKGKIKKWNMRK